MAQPLWPEETVFTEGDAFFENVLQAIDQAKHTIRMETYIFDQDSLGSRVLNSLSDAASRGVNVHLLLDGAGCSQWDFSDAQKYRKENFKIHFFHPLTWQRKKSNLWKFFNLRRITRGASLLNHRNHRKVTLIDNDIAFVGSMNVSAWHLQSIKKNLAWKDASVRVRGPGVHAMIRSFDLLWNNSKNYIFKYLRYEKNVEPTPLLRFNYSNQARNSSYQMLLKRLENAQQKIWITNPYFIPTKKILKALCKQARSGIDVAVLFPEKGDFFPVKLAMEGFYTELLKSGVKIFEYQPSMIHAKILFTDDKVMLGSSNLNSRSLMHDLEIDVEITHPKNRLLLQEQFQNDLSHSQEIILDHWKKRSWIRKILEKLFQTFRWIL